MDGAGSMPAPSPVVPLATMTMTRDDLARLARRDARIFIGGSIAALVTYGVLVLIKAGVLSTRHAASVIVVIAAIVVPVCLAWWLVGPRELRSQRYLVLAPLGLISGRSSTR